MLHAAAALKCNLDLSCGQSYAVLTGSFAASSCSIASRTAGAGTLLGFATACLMMETAAEVDRSTPAAAV